MAPRGPSIHRLGWRVRTLSLPPPGGGIHPPGDVCSRVTTPGAWLPTRLVGLRQSLASHGLRAGPATGSRSPSRPPTCNRGLSRRCSCSCWSNHRQRLTGTSAHRSPLPRRPHHPCPHRGPRGTPGRPHRPPARRPATCSRRSSCRHSPQRRRLHKPRGPSPGRPWTHTGRNASHRCTGDARPHPYSSRGMETTSAQRVCSGVFADARSGRLASFNTCPRGCRSVASV